MDTSKLITGAPWIVAGGILLGGIYLYRGGYGVSTGTKYTAITEDNSQAIASASELNAMNKQAQIQGFGAIAELYREQIAAETSLRSQTEAQNYETRLAEINAGVERHRTRAASRAATQSAVAGIASAIIFAAMFCYDTTANETARRLTYTHGLVQA